MKHRFTQSEKVQGHRVGCLTAVKKFRVIPTVAGVVTFAMIGLMSTVASEPAHASTISAAASTVAAAAPTNDPEDVDLAIGAPLRLAAAPAVNASTTPLPSVSASTATVYNGNTFPVYAGRTQTQILQAYAKYHPDTDPTGSPYTTAPSTQNPYSPGAVSNSWLNSGLNALNYYRWLNGVPAVTMDTTLNAQSQYGAVLIAAYGNATGQLTHTPPKPADMPFSFYNQGYAITSAQQTGWACIAEGYTPLNAAVRGYIDDDRNIEPGVGHRQVLFLNNAYAVGFGMATDKYGVVWSTLDPETRIMTNTTPFTSWPSPGYFPSNGIETDALWSVTPNTSYVNTYNDNITVTITDLTTGKVYQDSQKAKTASYDPSFNALSFNPPAENSYIDNDYQVTVTGFYMNSTPVNYTYRVSFFAFPQVNNIILNTQTLVLFTNTSANVTSQELPANAVDKAVQWTSDDEDIATVTNNGTVTAVDAGTTTVKVIAQDGSDKSASVKVIVIKRMGGSNRYGTAQLISQQDWTTSKTVYLAYGGNYPDALAAVPLASLAGAPILLTEQSSISPSTLATIKSLGARNVVLLGDTGVISVNVASTLRNAGYQVSRLAGSDRFDTAAKIGQAVEGLSKSTTAVLATGMGYADALSIGPVAGMKGWPVVFSMPNTLPSDTRNFLRSNNIKTVVIVGGPGVVSDTVKNQLLSMGIATTRIYGSNRYETSAQVVTTYRSLFSGSVSLATGAGFADALTGGAMSAKEKMPLLLLNPSTGATASEKSYVKGLSAPRTYVYGGTGALPNSVVMALYQ